MIVETTANEIIIKIPSNVDVEDLQDIIDYIEYKEATAKSVAKQEDVDELVREVKMKWSKKYWRPGL